MSIEAIYTIPPSAERQPSPIEQKRHFIDGLIGDNFYALREALDPHHNVSLSNEQALRNFRAEARSRVNLTIVDLIERSQRPEQISPITIDPENPPFDLSVALKWASLHPAGVVDSETGEQPHHILITSSGKEIVNSYLEAVGEPPLFKEPQLGEADKPFLGKTEDNVL